MKAVAAAAKKVVSRDKAEKEKEKQNKKKEKEALLEQEAAKIHAETVSLKTCVVL